MRVDGGGNALVGFLQLGLLLRGKAVLRAAAVAAVRLLRLLMAMPLLLLALAVALRMPLLLALLLALLGPLLAAPMALLLRLLRARRRVARLEALDDAAFHLARHQPLDCGHQRAVLMAHQRNGLAFVSVDAPRTRASNVIPSISAATHPVAYVRFHGRNWKTWNIRGAKFSGERFDWLYSADELAEWTEPVARFAREGREVYAMFNNNRDDFAPRSAQLLRGLLDEAGVPAAGGVEPPPTEMTLF